VNYNSFTDLEDVAEARLAWLQKHGHSLEGRTPSHDVLNGVSRMLEANKSQLCFIRWTATMCKLTKGQHVSMGGKTLRASEDFVMNKNAMLMVIPFRSTDPARDAPLFSPSAG